METGLRLFDQFVLDPAHRTLYRREHRNPQSGGKVSPIRIEPRAMQVLMALVENSGQTVKRDQLLAKISPATVENNNVDVVIYQLRKALGDTGHPKRFIRSVTKQGYEFLNAVQVIDGRIDAHNRMVTSEAAAQNLTHHPVQASMVCIPPDQLTNLESTDSGGNLDQKSEVVVLVRQPLEVVDKDFAQRVASNLNQGATYFYLFSADQPTMVARLVYNLCTTALPNSAKGKKKTKPEGPGTLSRFPLVADRVKVYVAPPLWPFEFRIHNAQDTAKAKCYLRLPDRHDVVEFFKGQPAFEMSEKVKSQFLHSDGQAGLIRFSKSYSLPKSTRDRFWKDIELELSRDLEDVSHITKMMMGKV